MNIHRKLLIACLAASASACDPGPASERQITAAAGAAADTWEVCVEGHPRIACYSVSAVADDRDDDDDGLSNRAEMQLGLDPRRADTDRDGLADNEELTVHLSSPSQVDSDGDSHGNQRLWDGAEIAAGLSPVMRDSDGDGLDDYLEEIELVGLNGRVADLPDLALEPMRPVFELTGEYAEGASFAVGVTRGFAETRGIVTAEEVVYTEGESTTVTVGTEAGAGGGAAGGSFNFGVSASASNE